LATDGADAVGAHGAALVDVTDPTLATAVHIGLIPVLDLVVTPGLLADAATGAVHADPAQAVVGFAAPFADLTSGAIVAGATVEVSLLAVKHAVITARHLAQAVLAHTALTVVGVVTAARVITWIAVLAAAVRVRFVAVEREVVAAGPDTGQAAQRVVELAGAALAVIIEVAYLVVPAGVTIAATVHIGLLAVEAAVITSRRDAAECTLFIRSTEAVLALVVSLA